MLALCCLAAVIHLATFMPLTLIDLSVAILLYDPEADLKDRHVLLVEDIVDSGHTMNRLIPMLAKREPKSLEIVALLHKHVAEDLVKEPKWIGFDAPREFLVGYGLDHAEHYRNLPFVAALNEG